MGLPAGWTAALSAGSTDLGRLGTGQAASATWTIIPGATTGGAVAYHALASLTGLPAAHSIPVRITVTS